MAKACAVVTTKTEASAITIPRNTGFDEPLGQFVIMIYQTSSIYVDPVF